MRLGELCSSNPLRIPHSEIDKLACQAQSVGLFAAGEISLRDAHSIFGLRTFRKDFVTFSGRSLRLRSFRESARLRAFGKHPYLFILA